MQITMLAAEGNSLLGGNDPLDVVIFTLTQAVPVLLGYRAAVLTPMLTRSEIPWQTSHTAP